MHGVHLGLRLVRFAFKPWDQAVSPFLNTRYVNGSWIRQVQRPPFLLRSLYWDLMLRGCIRWLNAFNSMVLYKADSSLFHTDVCSLQHQPLSHWKTQPQTSKSMQSLILLYPVLQRPFVVFKLLFLWTFMQILEGRKRADRCSALALYLSSSINSLTSKNNINNFSL